MYATRPHHPRQETAWLPWIIGGALLFGLLSVLVIAATAVYALSRPWIQSGVMVAEVPVGGMSRAEAETILLTHNPRQNILITDADRSWTVPLDTLGIAVDWDSTLEAAHFAKQGETIQPRYWVDLTTTQDGLIRLAEQANIPATTSADGRAVEIPVMLDRLRLYLTDELADGVLDLTMIQIAPLPADSVNRSAEETTTHVVEAGQELGLIARLYGVTVDDILAFNDLPNPDIINVGQEILIPAAGMYTPTVEQAPPAPHTSGKSILVSIPEQRIYAYEDGQLIHSHLTSTGLPETPTVLGDYKIYVKYTATDMSGPGYYLPDVPYTMYFYQGYAIHGTYWHNSFGRQMSHGCVNLPPEQAKWFFDWAEVGTPVRVI